MSPGGRVKGPRVYGSGDDGTTPEAKQNPYKYPQTLKPVKSLQNTHRASSNPYISTHYNTVLWYYKEP